jgi:hypothetical protein
MGFKGCKINRHKAIAEIVPAAEAETWTVASQGGGGGANLEAETLDTSWPFGDLKKTDQIVNVQPDRHYATL